MNMHKRLLYLFPDFEDGDWVIQDDKDGRGPWLAEWNRPEDMPSSAAINTVSDTDGDAAHDESSFKKSFELKKDEAIIKWIAQLHGITLGQARNQLRTIWKNTS